MLFKFGENINLQPSDIQSVESTLANPVVAQAMQEDSEIMSLFQKTAQELKRQIPKAKDFLYFTAVMMHAAEAAILDDTGALRKNADGSPMTASWEENGESLKWVCSDQNVRPFKNNNGDIFPESELLKAHKLWVGKPLCLDHQSQSVDMVRGVIVDTYYDHSKKRVIALCALDKVNYPDLAHKVATYTTNCVSMGTGVERAICTDCGRVARAEHDFCDHMKYKSAYGEINLGLNPIELSIVVNGADPKAKIKHVIASANSLANYIALKERELLDLSTNKNEDKCKVAQLEEELSSVSQKLANLQGEITKLKTPETLEKEASDTSELRNISQKLNQLTDKVNQLYMENRKEGTTMTKKNAYFQGGGGVNEPTPGQVKYPKEDYQSIRDSQDKQMTPKPTDLGGSDGMVPGDAEKKRALQRLAEQKERAMRRQAALEKAKQAYHQGGGDVNEPTPGKPKYPKEDYTKIRDKEDKQMVGAPPFPGVGKVDSLYGDDLEKKKKLLRAELKGRFVKAARPDGSIDLGKSAWEVYADNKRIYSATVDEITGGRADSLFSSVATQEFGRDMLNRFKSDDFNKVAALYKGGQDLGVPAAPAAPAAAPAPAAAAAAPAPAAAAEPMAEMPMEEPMPLPESMEEPVTDVAGDPKEKVMELSEDLAEVGSQLSSLVGDMTEALDALLNEPVEEIPVEVPEAEVMEAEEVPMAAAASQRRVLTKLAAMKKDLRQALVSDLQNQIRDLRTHQQEYKQASSILRDVRRNKFSSNRAKSILALVREGVKSGEQLESNCKETLQSFVNYAHGTQAFNKRVEAAQKQNLRKMAKNLKRAQMVMPEETVVGDPNLKSSLKPSGMEGNPMDLMSDSVGAAKLEQAEKDLKKSIYEEIDTDEEITEKGILPSADELPDHKPEYYDALADDNDAMVELDTNTGKAKVDVPDGALKGMFSKADLNTREGRMAHRAKLAQKAQKQYSDMVQKAHPSGGAQTMDGGNELSKVETIVEQHAAHEALVNAPPKVRATAAKIDEYIKLGKLQVENLDSLVAQGLDKDAVAYWKKYFGAAQNGGKEFASELTREMAKKKAEEEMQAYKVKVARAWELAEVMASKGLIEDSQKAKSAQVDDILVMSDRSFDNLKKLAERQPFKKSASFPQVGVLTAENVQLPAPEANSDLREQLNRLFIK